MVGITVIRPGETLKRFHRRPNFPISGTMKPFGLYPIMAHPVLPGETLKSATTKWTVLSQPIVNPMVGDWLESWMFYVKITDMDPDLSAMFISDGVSTSGHTMGGDSDVWFAKTGQIAWMKKMNATVYKAFMINEGESEVTFTDGNTLVKQMKMNIQSWYQNMMFEPAEVALDTSGPRDATGQMRAWEMVQQMQMTELTYEKYLQQYGVRADRVADNAPEILRYSRSWTKPTSHVDPATGTPSSAWIWNDEMKVEKDKRFDEPGFIVMMACIRPKMYQKKMRYSLIGELWGFSDFFPAYTLADPSAGIKNITTVNPVFEPDWNLSEGSDDLIYDHRDLLAHGEQFINTWVEADQPYPIPFGTKMDGTAAGLPQYMRGEYCGINDINRLFVEDTLEKGMRAAYEGIVQLTIAGHVTDTTQ